MTRVSRGQLTEYSASKTSDKVALAPTEVIAEEKAVSYMDQLRARVKEIETQLHKLDADMKAGKISGDECVERRQKLKQMKDSLHEELQRMGVTT